MLSRGEETRRLVVELFPDVDPARVADTLRAAGAPVEGHGRGPRFGRITLRGPASALRELAGELSDERARGEDVAWIARRRPRRLLNGTSVWVGQSGLDGGGATPLFDRGLTGEGQIAGLLDTGVDIDHCAFLDPDGLPAINGVGGTEVDPSRRKVIAVDFLWDGDDPEDPDAWDDNGHGTHVAGTIAGDSLPYSAHNNHDGMAPAAKLVVQDGGFSVDDCADIPALGCPVTDLHFVFEQAHAQGVRVHQNSWGDNENSPIKSVYTDGSQDADEFVWAHPEFLLVFSAGNDGPQPSTVLSPATAKNVLSVGATRRAGEAGTMPGFSARGPTDDGRLKPDVTFPGVQIRSAATDGDIETENCENVPLSGTSMSGPGAAGMAVLARQYYVDGFYPEGQANPADGFTPSAALLKATLINSARSMEGLPVHAPEPEQGWGRVTLDDALHFSGEAGRLFVDDDGEGFADESAAPIEYAIDVERADAPLRATLVWTDYPSAPVALQHLVNDLDLALIGPGGEWLGNVHEEGESVPGGEPDRVNNVEQITLSAPTPGRYTLVVRAAAIPMGPQPFALVLRGELTAARVTPEGGETDSDSETGASTGDDASTAGESEATTGGATGASTGAQTSAGPTGPETGSGGAATTSEETGGGSDGGGGLDGDGCGCRGPGEGARGGALALLLALGWRRRRARFDMS
ncbi:MAG: S8 family serine peptidase [Myxococcales bacterium]|nr:S8 family serine peptidase [Myxococcales bacterium]